MPRRERRRARLRADGGRARRGRARRRAPARRSRCPSSSSPTSAPRCRVAATLFFGDPTRELERRGGHRHEREDDDRLPAPRDPRGGRASRPACSRTSSGASAASPRPTGLNTPEAIDLQRLLREMVDAGDRACVLEATSEAQAQGRLEGTRFAVLVFTNLTQDHLELPRHDGGLLRGQGGALRPGRPRGRQRRRRVRAGGSPTSLPDAVTFDADSDALDGIELQAARPLQPRERDRRRARRAGARRRRRRDPARDRVGRAACRAASRRSTRASRSP